MLGFLRKLTARSPPAHLSLRQCARGLTCTILSNPFMNPRRWVSLCYPLYRKGNGGTERASYWPKVTQLLAEEAAGSEA